VKVTGKQVGRIVQIGILLLLEIDLDRCRCLQALASGTGRSWRQSGSLLDWSTQRLADLSVSSQERHRGPPSKCVIQVNSTATWQ
jgi:hypothetical protein